MDAPCTICGGARDDHADRIHPFTMPDEQPEFNVFSKKRRAPEDSPTSLPFDPVLRQALLDKGILTAEELAAAAAKVKLIVDQGFPSEYESRGVEHDDARPEPR